MKYRLIIFDFDGTMADSLPWLIHAFSKVSEKFKIRKIDSRIFDTMRHYTVGRILKQLGIPFWKVPLIVNFVRRLMGKEIRNISLFNGVDALLRRLSEKGVLIAIVSSNSCENIRKILGAENCTMVRYYECGTSIFGKQKRIENILRKSRVQPDCALLIGDEIRDIEAAQKIPIAFGGVSWGYNSAESLRALSPSMMFTSIEEIAEKVS